MALLFGPGCERDISITIDSDADTGSDQSGDSTEGPSGGRVSTAATDPGGEGDSATPGTTGFPTTDGSADSSSGTTSDPTATTSRSDSSGTDGDGTTGGIRGGTTGSDSSGSASSDSSSTDTGGAESTGGCSEDQVLLDGVCVEGDYFIADSDKGGPPLGGGTFAELPSGSCFALPLNPYAYGEYYTHGDSVGGGRVHAGDDIVAQAGDPVYAAYGGTVRWAQTVPNGWGGYIEIEHQSPSDAPFVSNYGHLSGTTLLVQPGDTVAAGQQLGYIGTPAENGGHELEHLHFSIFTGTPPLTNVLRGHVADLGDFEDPIPFMASHGNCGADNYDAVGVSSGDATCVLRDGGGLRCFGWPFSGLLGYGVTPTQPIGDDEPGGSLGDVPVGASATKVDTNYTTTCAVTATETLRCWGAGNYGKTGHGSTDTVGLFEPASSAGDVVLGALVADVGAGLSFTCALTTSGDVRCFGQGGFLGYGLDENIGDDELPIVAGAVPLGGTVVSLGVGEVHSCAVLEGGSVRCWGSGSAGALGNQLPDTIGDDELPTSVPPINLGGAAQSVVAGSLFSCALMEGGAVRCWGFGADGRLGYGNEEWIGDDEAPATAGDLDLGGVAIQITAGHSHACALMQTGDVRCWGAGVGGALGYGSEESIGDDETPASVQPVELGGVAIAVDAGLSRTCAVLEGGAVRCWGSAASGGLGYGNVEDVGDDEDPAEAGDVPFL